MKVSNQNPSGPDRGPPGRCGPEQGTQHGRPPERPEGGRAPARLSGYPRDERNTFMMSGPALVSILRQDAYLIASVHTALDDSEMLRFQQDLIEQIGRHRSRGVVIDVAALDVLDSFAQRTLGNIAEMARLRGASA